MISQGKELRERGADNTLIAVEEGSSRNNKAISQSYFLEALDNQGLENEEEVQRLFQLALDEYNHNLWAKVMMNEEGLSSLK